MRPAPEAHLRLVFRSEEEARAIYEAIRPDNELLPRGLSIEGALSGRVVELHMVCERGLESLWATLDDLLACVQAAERALEQVKQGQNGPEGGGPARI